MPMATKLSRMGIDNEELPSIKSQCSPILIRFLVKMVSNVKICFESGSCNFKQEVGDDLDVWVLNLQIV